MDSLEAQIEHLKEQLALSHQNYDHLFENIGDSLFIIDLETLGILSANQHASRRLGYTHAELIGKSLDDIEIEDTTSPTQPLMWESLYSGTRIYECQHRHKNGSLIPVEVSSRILSMNGRDVFQNFARNIEVRKQLESERQQLIEDLDNFAHTVAHDIKNPLGSIITYASFLKEVFRKMSETELEEGLNFLLDTSKRSANIVEELLLFASVQRLEDINFSPLLMPSIINDVKLRLRQMIARNQATIITPDKWHTAISYAPWVQEIWVNYISNAIKYGGKPPLVQLGSDLIGNGMVRFWVRDNGAGISDENIPLLFKQFSRLRDMRVDGYGLGLSIVKRIVEKLGGDVGVESVLGKGSIFSFTLPAHHD